MLGKLKSEYKIKLQQLSNIQRKIDEIIETNKAKDRKLKLGEYKAKYEGKYFMYNGNVFLSIENENGCLVSKVQTWASNHVSLWIHLECDFLHLEYLNLVEIPMETFDTLVVKIISQIIEKPEFQSGFFLYLPKQKYKSHVHILYRNNHSGSKRNTYYSRCFNA